MWSGSSRRTFQWSTIGIAHSWDPGARDGRNAGWIADGVISHLAGLLVSSARAALEIEVEFADRISEEIVPAVTENSRTLKFTSHRFED